MHGTKCRTFYYKFQQRFKYDLVIEECQSIHGLFHLSFAGLGVLSQSQLSLADTVSVSMSSVLACHSRKGAGETNNINMNFLTLRDFKK